MFLKKYIACGATAKNLIFSFLCALLFLLLAELTLIFLEKTSLLHLDKKLKPKNISNLKPPFPGNNKKALHINNIPQAFKDVINPYFIKDPNLLWRLKPNQKVKFQTYQNEKSNLKINSLGLRGPEPILKHPASILCLGDSCTFGWKVEDSQAYPALLETILNEHSNSPKFQVINAGLPGYSSYQGLELLKELLPKISPIIVTAYFGINDRYQAELSDIQAAQNASWQNILQHWRLYCLLEKIISKKEIETRKEILPTSQLKLIDKASTSKLRVASEQFTSNLLAMGQLCKSSEIQFIVLTPPFAKVTENSEKYANAARKAALEGGLKLVDLAQIFSQLPADSVFNDPKVDPIHPNPEGYIIIAKAISEEILQLYQD